jgi:predicted nucleic acid-binding protein
VSRLVVTDTSCLIALDRVESLDLLPQLYDEVVAPSAVVSEFGRCPDWLREEAVEDRAAVRRLLLRGLDWGEAEAITLARTMPVTRLLVDEVRGRKSAVGFGLPILGTAGLLVVAKDAGLLAAIKPTLDALRDAHDFRLSDRLYADVLAQAGEA